MKVVCIDNSIRESKSCNLTIGKTYKVINDSYYWRDTGMKIKNDNGQYFFYAFDRFDYLEDVRQTKLNQLLSDNI
jgi:hypothetical protein